MVVLFCYYVQEIVVRKIRKEKIVLTLSFPLPIERSMGIPK